MDPGGTIQLSGGEVRERQSELGMIVHIVDHEGSDRLLYDTHGPLSLISLSLPRPSTTAADGEAWRCLSFSSSGGERALQSPTR